MVDYTAFNLEILVSGETRVSSHDRRSREVMSSDRLSPTYRMLIRMCISDSQVKSDDAVSKRISRERVNPHRRL